ncbi:unnamed protein product [Onchocerca flexuosa]|uniref:RING-type domain-containing protein n=1 Tax=Onchocerca flexuosa TaxID=387005 RepID=A0A183HWH4_9BILA|nr:unnamed protein product [Onchocerca flexuosa]
MLGTDGNFNKFIFFRCLRNWLEQDNSCPTCRLALPSLSNSTVAEGSRQRQRASNFSRVFRFSGTLHTRWLPSFSVQLSHNVTHNFFQHDRLSLIS